MVRSLNDAFNHIFLENLNNLERDDPIRTAMRFKTEKAGPITMTLVAQWETIVRLSTLSASRRVAVLSCMV